MAEATCVVEGCDRPVRVKSRGQCNMHSLRWSRHGDVGDAEPLRSSLPKTCSIDGCEKPSRARGWCNMHYSRWQQHGDVGGAARLTTKRAIVVNTDDPGACWCWEGGTDSLGYGRFDIDGREVPAHRISYETFPRLRADRRVGPIPDGYDVDHICHNPPCCNPRHLRAIPHKGNLEHRAGANKNSKSGILGVHWDKQRQKWCAEVHPDGRKYREFYVELADAAAAVVRMRNEHFTYNDADRAPADRVAS